MGGWSDPSEGLYGASEPRRELNRQQACPQGFPQSTPHQRVSMGVSPGPAGPQQCDCGVTAAPGRQWASPTSQRPPLLCGSESSPDAEALGPQLPWGKAGHPHPVSLPQPPPFSSGCTFLELLLVRNGSEARLPGSPSDLVAFISSTVLAGGPPGSHFSGP